MTLLVLGVNAKVASLTLREQLFFLPQQRPAIYAELLQQPGVQGVLLLLTCNRSEIYLQSAVTTAPELAEQRQQLLEWWGRRQAVPLSCLQAVVYDYHQQIAVSHLLRVAVGIDSLVMGESQILGQLKQAYHQAQQQQAMTSHLNWLFQQVFYRAKQIRHSACLGIHTVSLATRVCQLVRAQIQRPMPLLLLIGAGETIALVAKQLHKQLLARLIIAVRCPERALFLAQQVNAQVINLQQLTDWLPQVDGVISATGSTVPLLNQSMVAVALQKRYSALFSPLMLVDLAVPRDMAANIAELPGVNLYTLDQLQVLQQQRQQDACSQAEALIEPSATALMSALLQRRDTSLICQLREQGLQQRQRLEQQALEALQRGMEPDHVVQQLAYQLTNQLLHPSTQLMRLITQTIDESLLTQLQHQIEQLRILTCTNSINRNRPL